MNINFYLPINIVYIIGLFILLYIDEQYIRPRCKIRINSIRDAIRSGIYCIITTLFINIWFEIPIPIYLIVLSIMIVRVCLYKISDDVKKYKHSRMYKDFDEYRKDYIVLQLIMATLILIYFIPLSYMLSFAIGVYYRIHRHEQFLVKIAKIDEKRRGKIVT